MARTMHWVMQYSALIAKKSCTLGSQLKDVVFICSWVMSLRKLRNMDWLCEEMKKTAICTVRRKYANNRHPCRARIICKVPPNCFHVWLPDCSHIFETFHLKSILESFYSNKWLPKEFLSEFFCFKRLFFAGQIPVYLQHLPTCSLQ